MGDGETVISQTSAIEDYPSTSYSTTDDGDTIGNATETTVIEDVYVDNTNTTSHANNTDIDGNSEATDVDQQVPSTTSQDVNENGASSYNVHTSPSTQQYVDGSALSPEEDRLWNMDKVVEIKKVYDAFLAEFPLCYGYWKKYADHEARLGSIDKVVEVYEHGVQGVTYSVDMWLHYCVFAISTYEDPDTIRSCP